MSSTTPRQIAWSLLIAYLCVAHCSCGGWKTRYSGRYVESNSITINLDKDGNWIMGPCGIGREILESYTFDLKPVQRTYIDGEINLTRSRDYQDIPVTPVIGTVSFDDTYSRVKIDIRVPSDNGS